MSCSKYRWTEECDTHICVGDCDLCDYNNEDEEEIMPCPFCGDSRFEIFPDEEGYKKLEKANGTVALVMGCKNCNCELWEHTYKVKDYWERRNMLVEKWNTRHYIINYKHMV